MRVLMVQASSAWSGGEAVGHAIASNADGMDVAFAIPGNPDARTLARYQPFRTIIGGLPGPLGAMRSINRAIKEFKPDVVHAHGTRAKLWLWPVLMLHPSLKAIYTVHGYHIIHRPQPGRTIALLLEKITNWRINEIITTTKADRELMFATHTASAKKTRVIYNGIDPAPFKEANGTAFREEIDAAGKPIAVIVARLHPQKDIATGLRAWKEVLASIPDAQLVIVGDGPLHDELTTLADKLGIAKNVHFLGHRTDTPHIIAAANIVLLPTNWEGMALVPLEAGFLGKPVIATDVPGISEVTVDGETGYLVRPKDPGHLAERITKLLTNPELAERLGAQGHTRIETIFTVQHMATAYRDRYAALISSR